MPELVATMMKVQTYALQGEHKSILTLRMVSESCFWRTRWAIRRARLPARRAARSSSVFSASQNATWNVNLRNDVMSTRKT